MRKAVFNFCILSLGCIFQTPWIYEMYVYLSLQGERSKRTRVQARRGRRDSRSPRTRARPARSTLWPIRCQPSPCGGIHASPGKTMSSSSQSSVLASPGPLAGMEWGEDAMEDQAAAEGKVPPAAQWGWGWGVMRACERHERLVSLCGVCCVQGAVGYAELDVCALRAPFLVGYNEISFPFLIASLLIRAHLLPRIISVWRTAVISNSIDSHIVKETASVSHETAFCERQATRPIAEFTFLKRK